MFSYSQISNNTILSRYNIPNGYKRVVVKENSFAEYLRRLPLKNKDVNIKYYNGEEKYNDNTFSAVIDLPIGNKDLHQCADAVMRLRAEYLWNQKRYDEIAFNFTNGFKASYSKWRRGERILVKGNKCKWVKKYQEDNSYKTFWKYLEIVFTYAGTASLEKELKQKEFEYLSIGDVFIQGGFPGHAMIVLDVIANEITKEKMFLLGQSYMPAQELHIVINPYSNNNSSWFSTNTNFEVITPQWMFSKYDLKSF